MKRVRVALVAIAITISCTTQPKEDPSLKKREAVERVPTTENDTLSIEAVMTKNGLKGLSVAVFEGYKIIWKDSWGVKYDSVPLDTATAFSTASISKPITATLCVILEDKGLIDLNVPVNRYLKRWQLPESEFTKDVEVTLAHLLSHTAGTTQGGFTDFYEGDTIPSILESVQGKLPNNEAITFRFVPGTKWKYSGGGYTIAMMALEDHMGKPLADLAKAYIFDPLDLKHTTMKQPNEKGFLNNVAKAHNDRGEVIRTGIPITPQVSASGLWSTPTDLSLLLIEIQKALNGIGSDIISEKAAQRMTDIVTLKGIRGWSLGWERMNWYGNLDWFSHGGANTGIGGHVYATMAGGKGIVMFGNGPNRIRIPVTDMLRDNIIRTHQWGSKLVWENTEELPDSLITKIIGHYKDLSFGNVLEVKAIDGKLYFPIAWGGVQNNLIYVGDNSFIINDISGKFKFIFKDTTATITFLRDDTEAPGFTMFEKVAKP